MSPVFHLLGVIKGFLEIESVCDEALQSAWVLPARLKTLFTSDESLHIYFSSIKTVFTVPATTGLTPARFCFNFLSRPLLSWCGSLRQSPYSVVMVGNVGVKRGRVQYVKVREGGRVKAEESLPMQFILNTELSHSTDYRLPTGCKQQYGFTTHVHIICYNYISTCCCTAAQEKISGMKKKFFCINEVTTNTINCTAERVLSESFGSQTFIRCQSL